MTDITLECNCSTVKGMAYDVTPESGTRLVCYCNDCQAFPHHLGNADSVLDDWGGTDIYQMAQARLDITDGLDQIRCLRFGEKGLYRWYCNCCKTPLGNTLGPGMPFIGVIHSFMRHKKSRDEELGPSRGNVWVKFAKAGAPESISKAPTAIWLLLRSICKLLVWKLRGLHQPSPFFDRHNNPVSKPQIL